MTGEAIGVRDWRTPTDHPSYAGHFPGQPILPGVLLLATLTEAMLADADAATQLGAAPRLAAVKFLSPCLPGDALRFGWRCSGGKVAFEVRRVATDAGDAHDGELVASGQYVAVAA